MPPRGIPISRCILSTDRRGIVRRALAAIDQVHGVGPTPPISVAIRAARERNAHGEFDGTRRTIIINRGSPFPELALVHEIGHALDYDAANRPGAFASESEDSWIMSIVERLLVSHSAAVLAQTVHWEHTPPAIAAFARYLLRPSELFARAYAQYVALRSSDQRLGAQLIAAHQRPSAHSLPLQWDGSEFEALAATFDESFRAQGWRQ